MGLGFERFRVKGFWVCGFKGLRVREGFTVSGTLMERKPSVFPPDHLWDTRSTAIALCYLLGLSIMNIKHVNLDPLTGLQN